MDVFRTVRSEAGSGALRGPALRTLRTEMMISQGRDRPAFGAVPEQRLPFQGARPALPALTLIFTAGG